MQYKLIDLVKASPGLQKLILQDLPIRTAYKIMQLTEKANPSLMFYGQEAIKAGENEQRLGELENMEVSGFEDYEPIEVGLDSNIRLTPSDIKFLKPFISFIDK